MRTLTAIKPCGCTIAAVPVTSQRALYPLITSWIIQGMRIGRVEGNPVLVGCTCGCPCGGNCHPSSGFLYEAKTKDLQFEASKHG